MQDTLPCSPACERNRGPIAEVLTRYFAGCRSALEIGSGTGQHAVHFAAQLAHLRWQSSDRAEHLPDLAARIAQAGLANLPAPIELDVARSDHWPQARFDAAFSANTLHIMAWPEVEHCFAMLGETLQARAMLAVYGPFNYGGHFSSDSNAAFDAQLRSTDPRRGVRDFEAVDALARKQGLVLLEDIAMPANNRCLVWARSG
jgi:hypothetical protein